MNSDLVQDAKLTPIKSHRDREEKKGEQIQITVGDYELPADDGKEEAEQEVPGAKTGEFQSLEKEETV